MIFPSVAIVILNYNGQKHLENFLPSVINSSYPNKEIIVADNASTDHSVEFVQKNFPSITVLKNTQNSGFAGGYNWAMQHIASTYSILLNSDVEVTINWIEPIITLMESNSRVAACQPKILAYHNKNSFEYAGASGGFIDALGYPFSRGRIFDKLEQDTQQYNAVANIFWASGAAMFIRTAIFKELDGFDARFFAHQEEIDLCWRLQLAGYTIQVCPTSVVYHVGAGTLPRGGRKVYLNFRNNLLMLSKNLVWYQKMYKLPFRFLLDTISAYKGLLNGDINFFKAIAKAHIVVVYIWLKGYKATQQKKQPMQALQGVYNGSIVWQHFVKHKNKYTDIIK